MKKTLIFIILIIALLAYGCNTVDKNKYTPKNIDKNYKYFFPLIAKSDNLQILYGIENEGYEWEKLVKFYPNNILVVSISGGLLSERGYEYFDRKWIGQTGKIILKIKGAFPEWVDPTCAPIPKEYWDNWVYEFAVPAIERIDIDKLIAVELHNEPDTSYASAEYFFGCWGETYQDGQYLAEFVNYVYPILKQMYPDIIFVSGAFMNPNNSFAYGFASKIEHIDAMSFHVYPYCGNEYIDDLFQRYDQMAYLFPDYPIWLSETNMIYNIRTDECDIKQGQYVHDVISIKDKWEAAIFYTSGCNGWKCADFIWPCSNLEYMLRPAYWAFINQIGY